MKSLIIGLCLFILLISYHFKVVAEIEPEPLEPEIITITETIVEYKTIIETITETIIKEKPIIINQTEPMIFEATAYTSGFESTGKHPGHPQYGITATGTQAKRGVCAVDNRFIAYGTHLYVDGYGICRAEDRGSAIQGYSVDVWMETVKDALEFGRSERKVWILEGFEDG